MSNDESLSCLWDEMRLLWILILMWNGTNMFFRYRRWMNSGHHHRLYALIQSQGIMPSSSFVESIETRFPPWMFSSTSSLEMKPLPRLPDEDGNSSNKKKKAITKGRNDLFHRWARLISDDLLRLVKKRSIEVNHLSSDQFQPSDPCHLQPIDRWIWWYAWIVVQPVAKFENHQARTKTESSSSYRCVGFLPTCSTQERIKIHVFKLQK